MSYTLQLVIICLAPFPIAWVIMGFIDYIQYKRRRITYE